MENALAILSVLVVAWVLWLWGWDLLTKRYEALSFRNVFLLGFALYYGTATYFHMTQQVATSVYSPGEYGVRTFFMAIPLFLILYMVSVQVGFRWRWLERVVPPLNLPLNGVSVLTAIAALTFVGAITTFVAPSGYLTSITSQFKHGCISAAVGLSVYYLVAHKFNPFAWGVFGVTLVLGVLLASTGGIGRRGVMAIGLIIGWMWYFYSLRGRSVAYRFGSMAVLCMAGTFMISAMSLFRFQESGLMSRADFGARMEQFRDALVSPTYSLDATKGLMGSDAPLNTMFIMENYPGSFDYIPFHGAIYYLSNPIPRAMWPEKPEALGFYLPSQMGAFGVNVGAGIIGHGWAEMGWAGVVMYAVFFGVICGAGDMLVKHRMHNPFFIAAIGSDLGNHFALARGETSLFLLLMTASIVGCNLVLYLVGAFITPVARAFPPLTTRENAWAYAPPSEDAETVAHSEPEFENNDVVDPMAAQAYVEGGAYDDAEHGAAASYR